MLNTLALRQVSIGEGFWAPIIRRNREVTLQAVYRKLEETGRLAAWDLKWRAGEPNPPHVFWDSDVAKWLEAACASLESHPDSDLQQKVDDLIRRILAAQQPDGYINTHFTVVRPEMRFKNLRDWHELYCAGHLIEAAVAHHQATGESKFLQAVRRYADLIDATFGREPGKRRGYPGHEEIELALVRLFDETGDDRYLRLAAYFVDERGRAPHYFDLEARERGEDPADYCAGTHEYTQSHLPVRRQTEPVGHAVRAMYLYCAMTDLAARFGDRELQRVCRRLWRRLAQRRLYLHGGIGSSAANEGFTRDYDLPNEAAYAETCAAIGLVLWAHRMLHLEQDAAYADVMEQALYNNVLAGVSLSGDRFFYRNPLASRGDHHRQPWFDCACCPPNLARLLATLPRYLFGRSESGLWVHLFAAGTVDLDFRGVPCHLRLHTRYPWEGTVQIAVECPQPVEFDLALRIPGWCRSWRLHLNGKPVEKKLRKGYLHLKRKWRSGDTVDLALQMPVERVEAHPAVGENAGRVALRRGPLLYCLEEVDNGRNLADVRLPREARIDTNWIAGFADGIVELSAEALRRSAARWKDRLYSSEASEMERFRLRAIPYFAWDNRKPGEMQVWLLQD